jgi:hypothetical protein
MILLQSVVLIGFVYHILGENEVRVLSFDSSLENHETIKIFPNTHDENMTTLSTCLRAKFRFWNAKYLFKSENLGIFILDYKILGGYIQVGKAYYHFRWPETKITTFSSWNSFCLAIDKSDASLNFTINGMKSNVTGKKELLRNMSLSVTPFIETGTFIGEIVDFNVWNRYIKF